MKLSITPEQTCNSDLMLPTEDGFPLLYIGKGSYIQRAEINSYSSIDSSCEVHIFYVGRYTSIGSNLNVFFDMNHDYNSIYQGLIPEYRKEDSDTHRIRMGQNYRYTSNKGMIVIGNDVWIGNDVSIVADCIIGDGAVIGAGSIVTQDIPPYTIWVGNPARQIKERFPTEIAKKLQSIQWWNLSGSELRIIENDMRGDVWSFVQKYYRENIGESPKKEGFCLSTILAFVDAESDYSTFGNIVEEYISKLKNDSVRLRLAYHDDNDRDIYLIPALYEILIELNVKNVDIVKVSNESEEELIRDADYMVIGRDIRFIDRISIAFKYNVKLISGVDYPIFARKIVKEIKQKDDLGIFVVGHKKYIYPVRNEYKPIFVGDNNIYGISGMYRDDAGDNIHDKNKVFCEMTAVYWVWKNICRDFKYIGFCHYRRYLTMQYDTGKIISQDEVLRLLEVERYDFILPCRFLLPATAGEYYYACNGVKKDLDIMNELMKKEYGDYYDSWEKRMNSVEGHYCNMFITSAILFEKYCNWVFPILFKAEQLIDMTGYTREQKRVIGYLAEFMLDVWIDKNGYSYVEVDIYNPKI